MAEVTVQQVKIGASAKLQIVLPSDFSSYTDITANLKSNEADNLIISKNKKVAQEGYKTLVVDPDNTKATWVTLEATESEKASEGLFLLMLDLKIPDSTYSLGYRVEKYSIPAFMLKK